MEEQMRKSPISIAVAIVAALSAPAHAGKFSCVFYGTGIPPTPVCSIDSSNPNLKCENTFPGNLMATCADGGNLIRCLFHTDRLPAEAQQEITASSRVPFLAAPGLLAGGVAEASTKLLLAGYKE